MNRWYALLGFAATFGCEQPKLALPPAQSLAPVGTGQPAPAPLVSPPVQPEPPPTPPADLPPLNPPPGPPRMAPPEIHWHERLVSEGIANRQQGLRFRVIYFQSPPSVSTRVSVKDRYGRETAITANHESGLTGYAGIDEVIPGMTRTCAPFAVKVEYLDPVDNSWNDAVGYEFLPRQ